MSNTVPAVAGMVVAVVITAAVVGVLVLSRNIASPLGSGAASAARVTSPSPTLTQSTVQLVAPSTNVVWVLVDYGSLYRSTDQGGHWTQRPMPAAFGGRPAVSFIDDHEGWLLAPGSPTTQCEAAPASVWHTTDGAASWQQLKATGLSAAQCKEWITFADAKQGFITAWDPNHQPTIYHTADGGLTWKGTTLPDPADFKTQAGGFALRGEWVKRFGVTLYLEAWGHQGPGSPYPDVPDRQYIYSSTDGGATWTWREKTQSRSVVMVSELRWLDLAAPGQSMETVNGGQQFHQYPSDFNTDAAGSSRLVFADPNVGYAEGNGLLQRTLDGGAHWVRIASPGVQPAGTPRPSAPASPIAMPSSAAISAPSSNVVWALVAGQYLFRSTDQGKSWQQRSWAPYPGGGGDPLISFADDTTGWALFPGVPATQCTQQGAQLWRTTDGATTWQLVSVVQYGQVSPNGFAFEQCKEPLYFSDASHGFVGADDPMGETVYRTSDGGLTWSGAQLPYPPGLAPGGQRLTIASIKEFGSTVLLYAPPYVFASTDGGATFAYVTALSKIGSVRVTFVTAARWLDIQGGLETTDSGASWHAFTSDYSDAAPIATDFVFASDQVGYGTVRGDLHRTIDGGAHWEMIKTSWP